MQHKLIIVSEGPHHIAVFKPHNMSVVGGPGVVRPTLLDLMRERFGKNIFAVHRLDRVTAGITIFARSIFAKHAFDNAFKKRLVHKTYWAIVEGTPNFTKISVDKKLQRVDSIAKKSGPLAHQSVSEQGEHALTHFQVVKKIKEGFWLIEANPVTGRLHQIRAHLQFLGLAILGDKQYGAKTVYQEKKIALCAVGLTLPAPKGAKIIIDAKKLFSVNDYLIH